MWWLGSLMDPVTPEVMYNVEIVHWPASIDTIMTVYVLLFCCSWFNFVVF